MSYATGQNILDDEYNIFATGTASGTPSFSVPNVNSLFGTGQDEFGYGQAGTLSTVSPGQIVSATQWATLLNRMNTIASHQGTALTPITNPVSSDIIEAVAALQTNMTSIWNNRHNAAANGVPITTGGVSQFTTQWNTSVALGVDIQFASADHLRYFFNAGGRIGVQFSLSPIAAGDTNREADWSALCTAAGTLYLTGAGATKTIAGTDYTGTTKIGGSGAPTILTTGTGVNGLTTGTYTTVFKQYSTTALYTANFLSLDARFLSSAKDAVGLRGIFQDDYGSFDLLMNDYPTMTVTLYQPDSTYLLNSWGTPTMGNASSGS